MHQFKHASAARLAALALAHPEILEPPKQKCPVCSGERHVGYLSSDDSAPPELGDCYACDGTGLKK
jgi:hypothetical protein